MAARQTKKLRSCWRDETVAKLPTFKEGFRFRRCLILAHGFYDSENIGKWKQPWHIHLKDDELMCFARLWEKGLTAFLDP